MIRASACAAAAAITLSMTGPVAATAAASDDAGPYTYTRVETGGPSYAGNAKLRTHPLGASIDIQRVRAGRDADTAYMQVELRDVLTPRQVRNRAPFAKVRLDFSLSKPASDGVGRLGFTAAEVTIDRDGVTVYKPREGESCRIEVRVMPRRELVAVAAPYACGLEDDPAGEKVHFEVWVYTEFHRGEKPASAAQTFDASSFYLDSRGRFAGR